MTDTGNAFADHRTREFGWSGQRAYLNAASFGPLPQRSKRAIDAFNAHRWEAALTDADLMAPLGAARNAAARLVGADEDEIALTPNTNIGINIAAMAAFQLGDKRRTILISDREFPANVYPWLALERSGFRTEIIPTDARRLPDEDALVERVESGDIAVLSISFVQFASGFRADLARLGIACRKHGTLFVVDSIQGLGAVPLNVRACHVDVLACGGQKWLCAPWASGFAYIRRELVTRFEPLLPGWLAFTTTQDFGKLTEYKYELLDDARRFETGSLGFQDFLGLQHSLELLLELDVHAVWQHIRALQEPIIAWAREHGVEIVSSTEEERRSGILCVRPREPDAVYRQLLAADIRCALRENSIRLSPHWYNTSGDIERALELLTRAS